MLLSRAFYALSFSPIEQKMSPSTLELATTI